jgi:penicillin-binding protein 1A
MAKPRTRRAKKKRTSRFGWKIVVAIALLVIGFAVCAIYGIWASTFDMKDVAKMPERSVVYDYDGKFYSRLYGEDRVLVKLNEVSPHFVKALLAREDTRFHKHNGVDVIGIVRAMVRNLVHLSAKEGGSTITQQLARNSFPLGGKTLHRKLLEAFVALRIEQHFSKDEILEAYVNRIYFGSGFYGVETASRAYFGKPAAKLGLGESAMLVGLIRSPTRFSPFNNLKGSMIQRDTVLERMVGLKMISRTEADAAKRAPVNVSKRRAPVAQENYAMDALQRDIDIVLTGDQLDEGGLKIYTTIDPRLQKAAMRAVEEHLSKIENRSGYNHPKKSDFTQQQREQEAETPYLQGAVVVLDNKSGGIRALVGGRDYAESKYNRALDAKRQVGSTFKPFVYAAAYNRGLLPGAAVDDGPIRAGEIKGAANWTPENSDGGNKGIIAAAEGLVHSRNTMSVRVGELAGLDEVVHTAANVGLTELPRQPSIYLGAFEGTLRDMAVAYSVFPNDGIRRQPYIIERIDNAYGEVLYRAAHISAPAIDPGVCWMITSALQEVLNRGTASSARSLGWSKPAAGKTGTTNDYHDAWFAGYTTSLTCAVWVGLDQPAPIMSRGYGSALALPIWVEVMSAAPASHYAAAEFRSAVPQQRVVVCSVSNLLATTGCTKARSAYEIPLPVSRIPNALCTLHEGGALTRRSDPGKRRSVPESIARSFRRFFGGR